MSSPFPFFGRVPDEWSPARKPSRNGVRGDLYAKARKSQNVSHDGTSGPFGGISNEVPSERTQLAE